MALAKLSIAQAALLVHLRNYSGSDQTRKDMKADMFKLVKDSFGIPHDHKLSVEIDNASSPDFLVLKRKKNGMPYDLGADGRWVEASQPVAPAAPAPKRWFKFTDLDVLFDEVMERLLNNSTAWDDGTDTLDHESDVTVNGDFALVEGGMYVRATREDFYF